MRNMNYCSPFSPFVLGVPHKLVWTICNGLVVAYFFVLNPIFVCFSCRQCLHKVLVGFVICGIYLTSCFFPRFIRLSKFIWPNILYQIQLSSSLPKQQLSFPILFKIYMLFGVLVVVATSLPNHFLQISHSFELNRSVCPWSHIWLTLNILLFMFSISRQFSSKYYLFPILFVPFSHNFGWVVIVKH